MTAEGGPSQGSAQVRHAPQHDTDCAVVLQQVYVYLDGELPPASIDEIREHLDECSDCLEQYGLEKVVKDLLVRSCVCEDAPSSLKAKVLTRIQTIRIELSTE